MIPVNCSLCKDREILSLLIINTVDPVILEFASRVCSQYLDLFLFLETIRQIVIFELDLLLHRKMFVILRSLGLF